MTDAFARFQECYKNGLLTEALQIAEAQYPDAFWLTQQAKVLNRLKNYADGFKQAKQALALDTADAYAYLAAGDALANLKNYPEAAEYYLEAARFKKIERTAAKKYLSCLVRVKKWQTIIDYCTKLDSTDVDFFAARIEALVHLKKAEEAALLCRQWLKESPHHPIALKQLVELEIAQYGLAQVTENMERMAGLSSLPPVYAEIYADLCRRTGNREAAARELEKLGAVSGDPWIQKRRVYDLANSGREDEAIPLFEEFLQHEPEETHLHASYAAACRRAGRLEQALAFYRTLLASHPAARSLYGRIAKIKKQLENNHV